MILLGELRDKSNFVMLNQSEYLERVYAGVLGKMIGVYLGRPIEGWSYERITDEIGEINYYVNQKVGVPLVVTDDDIAGTFTFIRAIQDHGYTLDLTPEQIGLTWLNYLIENRTILWWGGLGNSTEHTAYLRLKQGIMAPRSGSAKLNGKILSEQIGAQIFIDGWAMIVPGDPELAADLAFRASSVSHDGEAIYAAQVIAAMESAAFNELNIDHLIDIGVSLIPKDSVIYQMIDDLREWHAKETDWRMTREKIVTRYGYKRFLGNCHVVPNHGLIILGLLYGNDDFQKSLMITNTSGWDTDCNSGNLGCLLGIKNGLACFEAGFDWRGPIADRLFLSSADGGRAITDAVIETYNIYNTNLRLNDLDPIHPKSGARFHFSLPGSLQGFQAQSSLKDKSIIKIENVLGHSKMGDRSLKFTCTNLEPDLVNYLYSPTFIQPDEFNMPGYYLVLSPTAYSGQTLHAAFSADEKNLVSVFVRPFCAHYNSEDKLVPHYGPKVLALPGQNYEIDWRIPKSGGQPIAQIGLTINSKVKTKCAIYLDYLTWDGAPSTFLTEPKEGGQIWKRAWVDGLQQATLSRFPFHLIQNIGQGIFTQGTSDWKDYSVRAEVYPTVIRMAGIAARVQGMKRFYALVLNKENRVKLIKIQEKGESILGEKEYLWKPWKKVDMRLKLFGNRIRGYINRKLFFDIIDDHDPLLTGMAGFVVSEGHIMTKGIKIEPVNNL